MKLLAFTFVLIPFAVFAKSTNIEWLENASSLTPFWEEGAYRTKENSAVIWLKEIPKQYPKLKAFSRTEWFNEQKVLGSRALFRLSSEYKLSARKAGKPTSFLYVKGRSEEFGEGWAIFIGNKKGVSTDSAVENFEAIKELWRKDAWATREISIVRSYKVNGNETSVFEDDFLRCSVSIGNDSIDTLITNKTEKIVEILWNESTIVDSSNFSSSVIVAGTRLIEKDKDQKPTFIPPKANFHTSITPSRNIHWFESVGKWHIMPLIPNNANSGKIQIYLSLKTDGVKSTSHIEVSFDTTRAEPSI